MSGFTLETKAVAGINNVAHKTQVAESAALGGNVKLEWVPQFDLAGKPVTFALQANEATVLQGVSKLQGAMASVKVKPTDSSAVTLKYFPDSKLVGATAKLDLKNVANRTLTTELKYLQGSQVATETEYHLDALTKFQVETLGKDLDAVKLTRTRGQNQLKLKYSFLQQAPIIGLETYQGPRKWDFEYNVKTERLDAKVKMHPLHLHAATTVGKSGFAKGGISYKLTGERTFEF